MSKLSLKGLKLFKKKNDETYLKQNEAIELSDLKEVTTVDDDDIIIKGQAETGDLVRIKASDFFAKLDEMKVNKSGDTMTGDLTINSPDGYGLVVSQNEDDTDTRIKADSVWGGNGVSLLVGSGGVNRGIYDDTQNGWMLHRNADGNIYLGGRIVQYGSGQSFTATISTAGYLTSSNTNVCFTAALDTVCGNIESITVNSLQIRQNGSYLVGSSSGSASFSGTVNRTETFLGTRITLVFGSSIGGTNNDAVGITAELTVKFA